MDIANICAKLRKQITGIVDDLPSLRDQADANDQLARHLIDRLLVATDNATGCVVLAEHGLGAPLASAARSILESLFATYWSSQSDEAAASLLSAMRNEALRLMRLNLIKGHAKIRYKKTGADHTEEILSDSRMAAAGRPPQFRMMAEQSGLANVYDELYGFKSMFAHGTATELLANRNQQRLILANLHSVGVLLNCIHLIVANRIREHRLTSIAELEAILRISLAKPKSR